MLQKLLFVFALLTLTACGMLSGNAAPQTTAIPTLAPALGAAPDAKAVQGNPLGGKQSGDLSVWIYSNPNPPIRGANTFEAVLADAKGQPVTDAKISFDLDMTNMSHGKNVVAASPLGAGRYTGKVSFQMPGPWRVLVAIERGGQTSTVRFDFSVNSR
jgi:hypothetical protein